MGRLGQTRPGLTPLTLPANTYPQQHEAVTTVASAALLLTTVDAPVAEVERLADLVFRQMPQRAAGCAGCGVDAGAQYCGGYQNNPARQSGLAGDDTPEF